MTKPKYEDITPLVSLNNLSYILGIKKRDLLNLALHADTYYSPFIKKTGTKERLIDNPTGEIKHIQNIIHRKLLSAYPFPAFMIGGRKGLSIKNNAEIHIKKKTIVTIDIKDCFPSTSDYLVFDAFKKYFKCSDKVASVLTRITTYKKHLPLGASTSTLLINLILLDLYNALYLLSQQTKLTFSMYIDDLTISGEGSELYIDKVISSIQSLGYKVRHKKIKIMKDNYPQLVTGLRVNSKLGVPKAKMDKYKLMLNDKHTPSEIKNGIEAFVDFVNPVQLKRLPLKK